MAAFEDLIFKMKTQGQQLASGLQSAVASIAKTQIKIPLNVIINKNEITKALKAAATGLPPVTVSIKAGITQGFASAAAAQRGLAARQGPTITPPSQLPVLAPPTLKAAGIRSQARSLGKDIIGILRASVTRRKIRSPSINIGAERKRIASQIRILVSSDIPAALSGMVSSFRSGFSRASTFVGSIASPIKRLSPLLRLAGRAARGAGGAFRGIVRGANRARRAVSGLTRAAAVLVGGRFIIGGPLFLPLAALTIAQRAFEQTAQSGDQVRQSIALFSNELSNLKGADRLERVNQLFGELRDQVFETASATGLSTKQVALGLQDILSAGFGLKDTSERFAALKAATNVAVGGVTDVRSAFRGLVAIARPFNVGFAKAADVLFAIQRLGIAPIAQLAPNLGRASAVAAQAGVSLDQFAAGIATATKAGIPLSSVVTGFRQIFSEFTKGGSGPARKALEELKKTLPGLNLNLSISSLRHLQLTGLVKELARADQQVVGQIFRRVRGLVPLLALLQNQALFQDAVNQVTNASGEAAAASQVRQQGLLFTVNRLKVTFDTLLASLGDQIAKFANIAGIIDSVTSRMRDLGETIRAIPKGDVKKFFDSFKGQQGIDKVLDFIARKAISTVATFTRAFFKILPSVLKTFAGVLAIAKRLGIKIGLLLARGIASAFSKEFGGFLKKAGKLFLALGSIGAAFGFATTIGDKFKAEGEKLDLVGALTDNIDEQKEEVIKAIDKVFSKDVNRRIQEGITSVEDAFNQTVAATLKIKTTVEQEVTGVLQAGKQNRLVLGLKKLGETVASIAPRASMQLLSLSEQLRILSARGSRPFKMEFIRKQNRAIPVIGKQIGLVEKELSKFQNRIAAINALGGPIDKKEALQLVRAKGAVSVLSNELVRLKIKFAAVQNLAFRVVVGETGKEAARQLIGRITKIPDDIRKARAELRLQILRLKEDLAIFTENKKAASIGFTLALARGNQRQVESFKSEIEIASKGIEIFSSRLINAKIKLQKLAVGLRQTNPIVDGIGASFRKFIKSATGIEFPADIFDRAFAGSEEFKKRIELLPGIVASSFRQSERFSPAPLLKTRATIESVDELETRFKRAAFNISQGIQISRRRRAILPGFKKALVGLRNRTLKLIELLSRAGKAFRNDDAINRLKKQADTIRKTIDETNKLTGAVERLKKAQIPSGASVFEAVALNRKATEAFVKAGLELAIKPIQPSDNATKLLEKIVKAVSLLEGSLGNIDESIKGQQKVAALLNNSQVQINHVGSASSDTIRLGEEAAALDFVIDVVADPSEALRTKGR